MAKSIDIIPITYKQSCKDARAQSRRSVSPHTCQTTTDHHRSPGGTTELCRAYSALIGLGSSWAEITLTLHRLPSICKPLQGSDSSDEDYYLIIWQFLISNSRYFKIVDILFYKVYIVVKQTMNFIKIYLFRFFCYHQW